MQTQDQDNDEGISEFLDIVSNNQSVKRNYSVGIKNTISAKRLSLEKIAEIGESSDDDDDKNKLASDKLVQWTDIGPGYTASGKTCKSLPPGVYNITVMQSSVVFTPHDLVTDELLRLPDSKSDSVVAEIEKFWTMKQRFKDFGFTHKRGFLLWGPQGSGKTSTVALVVQQMVSNGGIVIIGSMPPRVIAAALKILRQIEPTRQIVVVLEDIDAVIEAYSESDVLSLLDGEQSVDDVVFLATTNYPERLEARIANRPSRFDRVVKIDMPNYEARLLYLKSRNIGVDDCELKHWAKLSEGLSIAHLKEVVISVMCYEVQVDVAIKRMKGMARIPKSSDGIMKSVGFGSRQHADYGPECYEYDYDAPDVCSR